MKIDKQAKVQMFTAIDGAVSGAAQGARRASEDAPDTAPLFCPSSGVNTEVVARTQRRRFSNADKRRIVQAADACTQPGEVGALMRREGIYSSSLSAWRRQDAAGELTGAGAPKRGPKADPGRADALALAKMSLERDKLKLQLRNAQLVIEVQKKIAALLEQLEPARKSETP
jgi:transposase